MSPDQYLAPGGADIAFLMRVYCVQRRLPGLCFGMARAFCVLGQRKANQMTFTASRLLVVIALVLFVLAAFGVTLPIVELVALGLAFLAASFLVP